MASRPWSAKGMSRVFACPTSALCVSCCRIPRDAGAAAGSPLDAGALVSLPSDRGETHAVVRGRAAVPLRPLVEHVIGNVEVRRHCTVFYYLNRHENHKRAGIPEILVDVPLVRAADALVGKAPSTAP